MGRSTMVLLGMAMAIGGCSGEHVRSGSDAGTAPASDAGPIVADAGPATPDAPAAPDAPEVVRESLATCLAAGRGLREIAVVDNDDTTDHGDLLRLGLSPSGLVAAAGEDGTLKLWTLDAELVDTWDGTILTYGPEIPAAPIADIAFDGESILVGDIRGIVLQMDRGGSLFPIGGTTPEIPIRAIAFDPATRRLVHAQSGDVPPLVLRAEDGTTMELTSDVVISDLLFTETGTLLVAGERAGHPVLEALDTTMTVVGEPIELAVDGSFLEIARAPELGERAPVLVGVTTGHLLLSGETVTHEGGRSIALATDAVSAVALVAGSGGLDAVDATGTPGATLFHLDGDSVTVRIDASGTLAVLGGSDALIHVLACGE